MNHVTAIFVCANEGNFPASLDKESALCLFLEAGGHEFPFNNANRFCCDVSVKSPSRFLYVEYTDRYIARLNLETGKVRIRTTSPEGFFTDWFDAF